MYIHQYLLFQFMAQRFDLMYLWFCACVCAWISVVCVRVGVRLCVCVRALP